jgi:hypothetical protein
MIRPIASRQVADDGKSVHTETGQSFASLPIALSPRASSTCRERLRSNRSDAVSLPTSVWCEEFNSALERNLDTVLIHEFPSLPSIV